MSDTTESADRVRDMHDDYRSASCDAVARRVDECIANRARIVEQDAEIMRLRIELDNIAARRIA